jgi:TfoX/Sxy family transcriptional regulator of competence genes
MEIIMASDQDFVDFIVEQMEDAGRISQRKMFGEYAIYCDGKVVALICDDRLFVKPTGKGRAYIGSVVEAPPYSGAKSYFLIEDAFEDRLWLSGLIKLTAKELPVPKPKRNKAPRGKK